jgi:hypothetical protein
LTARKKDRTARKELPEWDRQNEASMTGLLGQDFQDMNQDRIARTALPG